MHLRYYTILSISIWMLFSCQKRNELASLDTFDVQVDKTTFNVGDSVKFLFSGTPENVVFWSGANGSNYDYKSRTVIEGNSIILNFNSFSQYGDPDQSSLKLLISKDFSGIYDSTNVVKATWTDITNKAVLSSGADQTPSGKINLDEFAAGNGNIALAFRYKTETVKTSVTQNRWVIRSFDLKSVNQQGAESSLATMATAGWQSFNFKSPSTFWAISSTQLISARSFTDLDDDWVITKQFNPNGVKPDKGQAIKNISQNLKQYVTTYSKPGTYKVVFVATNGNVESTASVTKELQLTIK